jgi:tetratricopeptide (TPR) repeat protein
MLNLILMGAVGIAMAYLFIMVVSSNPASTFFKQGVELFAQKKYDEAETVFQRALETDHLHCGSLLKLGEIHDIQGNSEKALSFFLRALKTMANPFEKLCMQTQMRVASLHYSLGKYQDAWQDYLLLLKLGYQSAELYFRLGELYMIQRRYGEAVLFFDESLGVSQDQPKAMFFKVLCLLAMKEKREALGPLKVLEKDPEYGAQALFLEGKIYHDLSMHQEADACFGALLAEKNPIYLKDILLYKGYTILKKNTPSEEEMNRAIQYFNRGIHIKDLFADVKKEFLFHLGGIYLIRNQWNEAKLVYKDLCKIDAFYKGADQILKAVSKEMLIKEEQEKIVELYQKFRRDGHISHEIDRPVRFEDFFPRHLPVLVLSKLEENAQKRFFEKIRSQESITARVGFTTPKSPMELSVSKYEVFLQTCVKLAGKLGVVVDKNLGEHRSEAVFVGIDRSELKTLVLFSKPASLIGAIGVLNAVDRKEKLGASKVHYFTCGTFTEEARERAREYQVSLLDRNELKRML